MTPSLKTPLRAQRHSEVLGSRHLPTDSGLIQCRPYQGPVDPEKSDPKKREPCPTGVPRERHWGAGAHAPTPPPSVPPPRTHPPFPPERGSPGLPCEAETWELRLCPLRDHPGEEGGCAFNYWAPRPRDSFWGSHVRTCSRGEGGERYEEAQKTRRFHTCLESAPMTAGARPLAQAARGAGGSEPRLCVRVSALISRQLGANTTAEQNRTLGPVLGPNAVPFTGVHGAGCFHTVSSAGSATCVKNRERVGRLGSAVG